MHIHYYIAGIFCGLTGLPLAVSGDNASEFSLTSSVFNHQGVIPSAFTCDGKNISPQLSWTGMPSGTKSLVLIVDDPDAPDPTAPQVTWVHWVLYNIPASAKGLQENVAASALPAGAASGINDWKHTGYGGPCPPVGQHRYYFKLYALDSVLPDLKHPNKAVLEKAMQGHMIGHTELIGRYPKF